MKKIIALFCSIAICFSLSIPVFATETSSIEKGSFWDNWAMYVYSMGEVTGDFKGAGFNFIGKLMSKAGENSCPISSDHLHHGNPMRATDHFGGRTQFRCECDYCGESFYVWKDNADLSAAYNDYVTTLPAQGYTSTGRLTWQPTFSDIDFEKSTVGTSNKSTDRYPLTSLPLSFTNPDKTISKAENFNGLFWTYSNVGMPTVYYNLYFHVPVSGSYFRQPSIEYDAYGVGSDGSVKQGEICYKAYSVHYSLGQTHSEPESRGISEVYYCTYVRVSHHFPVFEVIPDTALSGDTYNTTTRPTSISGGNYGIVGDNGQITKVEDNSTIVNETNNTYYNPATGQSQPITNWSYDYSDRSYKLTLDGGKTSTITYGDENISIVETTVNESGDTITNNYTIYYLIDGSGSETPPCSHTWTETSSTPATCAMPGSKLLTCSKCQQTKTESIPALGHDWQVKQTVTTEYDDTGQLVQEVYTIYECSRCHEQYKAASGTSPPSNPSDPDASGEGVFSGIFGLLLDFLGFFWKTFKDFTKSGVKAFLDALKDGTSDIFGLLNPFDWSA